MLTEPRVLAVIPARWASSRFPGKPLANIVGVPMIQRVVSQTQKAKCVTEVIVATDDMRILKVVNNNGGTAVMTSIGHGLGIGVYAILAVLGLGFRGEVTDTRLSPTYDVVNEFLKKGCTVSVHDPYIFDDDNRTRTFMQRWFDFYLMQQDYKLDVPDESFRPFDMYTYWHLMNKTEFAIKRGYFPHPDARWQFIFNYEQSELDGQEMVITHRPIPRDMQTYGTGIN